MNDEGLKATKAAEGFADTAQVQALLQANMLADQFPNMGGERTVNSWCLYQAASQEILWSAERQEAPKDSVDHFDQENRQGTDRMS